MPLFKGSSTVTAVESSVVNENQIVINTKALDKSLASHITMVLVVPDFGFNLF